jgi:hypothetical protein
MRHGFSSNVSYCPLSRLFLYASPIVAHKFSRLSRASSSAVSEDRLSNDIMAAYQARNKLSSLHERHAPYIWIRRCILGSDGCGTLRDKSTTKQWPKQKKGRQMSNLYPQNSTFGLGERTKSGPKRVPGRRNMSHFFINIHRNVLPNVCVSWCKQYVAADKSAVAPFNWIN